MECARLVKGKISTQTRFFITSLESKAKLFAKAVRKHWGIENSLHWVLDVIFNEDYSRSRKDNSAHNLAVLRKIAINLIKAQKNTKGSIRVKRLRAALEPDFLLNVLTQKNATITAA